MNKMEEEKEAVRKELQTNAYRVLQRMAKEMGVKASGKRDDLIERILDHRFPIILDDDEEEEQSKEDAAPASSVMEEKAPKLEPVDSKPSVTSNEEVARASIASSIPAENQPKIEPADDPSVTSNEDVVRALMDSSIPAEGQPKIEPADSNPSLTSNEEVARASHISAENQIEPADSNPSVIITEKILINEDAVPALVASSPRKVAKKLPLSQYNDKDIATYQKEKEARMNSWNWDERVNDLSKPKSSSPKKVIVNAPREKTPQPMLFASSRTPSITRGTPSRTAVTPSKTKPSSPFKAVRTPLKTVTTPSKTTVTPLKNLTGRTAGTPSILTGRPAGPPLTGRIAGTPLTGRTAATPSKNSTGRPAGIPIKRAKPEGTPIKRRSASFGTNSPELKRSRPLTTSYRPLTVPDVTPRLEELARPKTPTASPARKPRRSMSLGRLYTPHSGPYEYVDTTKMTDAQYKEFLKKKKEAAEKHLF